LAEQLAWERTRVGVDHRQVGRQVLSDWGLPALLVECQQVVEEAKARQAPPLVRVTDFARRATEAFFLPQVNLADIYRVARLWFGLEDERVNQVLASTLDYVGEAAQALDIELNREADLLAIMEKANQALSRLSTQMAPALQQVVRGGGEAPKQAPEVARVREETMVDTLEAVAHEIRNPLMSVGGFARRLAEMTAGADERARQYAQVLLSQAARLDQVLSEMLAVTTPYRPRYQQLELLDLVREVSRSLQEDPPSNLSRPLPAIRWHLPEAPLPMRGDRAGLVSMLRLMVGYGAHLLSPPDKTLHVHLARRGERAVFTVFGPGRSEPAEDDALAGKSFGPELGLLRSRRIAEAHGGYLSVGSAPKGEGFVLTASLPLEPPGA
jgi:signal transduction histidine kinase